MKELLNKKWFKQLFRTKLGLLFVSFAWVFLWWVGVDQHIESDWALWVSLPAFLYILGLMGVWITYGVIINPIKEFIKRRTKKRENDTKEW